MFCPIDFLELCLDFEIATFTMIFKKNPQITNKSVFSIDFNAQTLRGDKSCFGSHLHRLYNIKISMFYTPKRHLISVYSITWGKQWYICMMYQSSLIHM